MAFWKFVLVNDITTCLSVYVCPLSTTIHNNYLCHNHHQFGSSLGFFHFSKNASSYMHCSLIFMHQIFQSSVICSLFTNNKTTFTLIIPILMRICSICSAPDCLHCIFFLHHFICLLGIRNMLKWNYKIKWTFWICIWCYHYVRVHRAYVRYVVSFYHFTSCVTIFQQFRHIWWQFHFI